VIERPDLVVIADASLLETPAAAVLSGVSNVTTALIRSDRDDAYHRARHGITGPLWVLPARGARAASELRFLGVECAGAAARLLGVSRGALEGAVRSELPSLAESAREESLSRALAAYEHLAAGHGSVSARSDTPRASADWIDLPVESAAFAAPAIHAGGTSALQLTGSWRTLRPVVDPERCHHCHWICGTLCPDGVISADESGRAVIDLEHCKGCMICVAQCPWQAISAVPEQEGAA
jgi:pyruvate ferredoxin oxidoreductase gamma subunit